jgi:hypothetical protein
VEFFRDLFTAESAEPGAGVLDEFLGYIPSLVTNVDNDHLLKPMTVEEVKRVVFLLDPDSAPGPDGFSGVFFQSCWELIAQDVFEAVQEFMVGVPIPRSVSSALMVLLPKKDSPSTFADYRPISLCNFVNKIFTRLLCERLRDILPRLVSPEQSAFVKGRDILDNVLLAQELLQHFHRKTRGHNMVLKLDMMKAFDRVSWAFLQAVLAKFGFSPHFVTLIANNLTASCFAVLINGSPGDFFNSTRGLKQGDPLSPILFVLVVDALSRGLTHLHSVGRLDGFALPRGAMPVTHLCFADDLVIFTKGNRRSLRSLFDFLNRYEAASGQRINKSKSSCYVSRRCPSDRIRVLAHLTGIPFSSLPFKYLGCWLFHGRRKRVYFQHIVDKIIARLKGWEGKYLSQAGRLILIKHVLSAIPQHVFAAIEPPKATLLEIERIFSRFFWGVNEDGKPKRVWRSWSSVAYPFDENGLGVRSLGDVCKSYSCKFWWKLQSNTGVWAAYCNSVGWLNSFASSRIERIADLMKEFSRTLLCDGSSSFLFTNWTGLGDLNDLAIADVSCWESACV